MADRKRLYYFESNPEATLRRGAGVNVAVIHDEWKTVGVQIATAGHYTGAHLTPAEAREMAKALNECADAAEKEQETRAR